MKDSSQPPHKTEEAALPIRYVGFWARAWATVIDTVLVTIVTFPLLLAVYGWAYLDSPAFVKGPWDFCISWILPALSIVGFWIAQSATPGKMLIKARIVDAATGGKPSPGQLILRYIGYLISSMPICLGFLWAAFDPKKQGWHDKLAKTVVVYAHTVVPHVQNQSCSKPLRIPAIPIQDPLRSPEENSQSQKQEKSAVDVPCPF